MKRFTFFLVTATLAGLLYVHVEMEAVKVGYWIRNQEQRKVQALDRGRTLKYNIASLKAPYNLEKKLLLRHIQLESPKSWNTLVLETGNAVKRPAAWPQTQPAFLTKFFIGTAQAEAKETQ